MLAIVWDISVYNICMEWSSFGGSDEGRGGCSREGCLLYSSKALLEDPKLLQGQLEQSELQENP